MIPLLIGGAISAIATAIGAAVAGGHEAEAQRLRKEFAERYGEHMLPNLDKAVAETIPESERARYDKATGATNAQSDALRQLGELASSGGETDIERAQYLRSLMETSRANSAATGAVERSMANRGLANSGVSAALQAQAAQQGVDRGAQMNMDNAANAQARRMDALRSLGSLGGQMRGQELQGMGAQDRISQFNASQKTDAQRYNLSLPQQEFENRLAMLRGRGQAIGAVAAGEEGFANNARRVAGGIGQTALGIGSSIYGGGKKKDDK